VGPGSVIGGLPYRVTANAAVAPIPARLAALLHAPKARDGAQPIGELDSDTAIARGRAYLKGRPPVSIGGRNNSGYIVACALKDLGLSADVIAELMLGIWNPRNEPPLDQWEVEKIAANAWASGQNRPGLDSAEAEFEPIPDFGEGPDKPSIFMPLNLSRPLSEIPPQPWLIKDFLMLRQLTGLAAAPGAGKSMLATAIAVSVAIGDATPLRMDYYGEPGKVMVISLEDNADVVTARALAYCTHNKIDPTEIQDRIYTCSLAEFPAVVRIEGNKIKKSKLMEQLRDFVKANGIKLVIFDTFVKIHQANENDNREISEVMAALLSLCTYSDCAGLLIHHSRKSVAGVSHNAGDTDMIRGASAFLASLRIAHTLLRITSEEAEVNGIPPELAHRTVRLDRVKSNHSRPGAETRWLTIGDVPMENGDGIRPAEYAPYVALIDPSGGLDVARTDLAVALIPHTDNGDLSLPAAVKHLAAHPMYAGRSETSLRRAIETLLAEPVTADGVTIVCEVANPEAAKPRKVVRRV
jgi:hypothetical protein